MPSSPPSPIHASPASRSTSTERITLNSPRGLIRQTSISTATARAPKFCKPYLRHGASSISPAPTLHPTPLRKPGSSAFPSSPPPRAARLDTSRTKNPATSTPPAIPKLSSKQSSTSPPTAKQIYAWAPEIRRNAATSSNPPAPPNNSAKSTKGRTVRLDPPTSHSPAGLVLHLVRRSLG